MVNDTNIPDALYLQRISSDARLIFIHYFRFVDKLSMDDAIRKVDDLEAYLRKYSND